ncbi:cysteine desulfurase [uncultured Clostridium sp.]|jgi:cysteine desulfurase/selenocysteine lyase|uniref:cysteine desulfurase n=1 Tax=uncultured Clostridium sp. TaxID=59620 RepID=UPI00263289AF|nr:cysteine desulfurase [uncultured Clostridium sp.]
MKNREFYKDFPTLAEKDGKRVIYLDSGATTQKPLSVIEAIEKYYKEENANPHRGAYALSVIATNVYEGAREKVRAFIGAEKVEEIIFTKNSTEAFNLLAMSYGMNFINEGDEIVISIAEHHSNLIPWQNVARAKKAILKYLYVDENGELTDEEINSKITDKTKLVSVTGVSNVLGIKNPIEKIIKIAHEKGAKVIIDGAQMVPHRKVDVQKLDADFLVFSGHKMLGPMGIGVLYGKKELLDAMPPYMFGGDMVEYVYEDSATFAQLPYKFEGGTQNVGAAAGLGAAIDYLEEIGMENVEAMEKELTAYALERFKDLPYIKIYGTADADKKEGVISFEMEGVHPHDVSSILDSHGVAVRAGNHCAQPLMRFYDVNSTTRASLYFYNRKEDIDKLIEGLEKIYNMFKRWM